MNQVNFFLNPFKCLSSHHLLLRQLIRRDIISRYRGSFLGIIWSLITPLLMLTIYTFVFSIIFKVRLENMDNSENKFFFAAFLFSGLIIFNLFSDCISRSNGLIHANSSYVKRIIFPLEILPWVTLGAALFHAGISFIVLLFFLLAIGTPVSWMIMLLPVTIFPLALLIVGFSWFFSSLGVFIRDIGQVIGLVLTMLLFLSPIFYPASALPESVRDYLYLNPLTIPIEQTRNIMIWGKAPNWLDLGIYYIIALGIFYLGFIWFERTRKGFADVI